MKKEISIYKLLLIVLVILNLFLLFKVYNESTKESITISNELSSVSYDSILFQDIFDAAIKSNGIKLNRNLEFTSSTDQKITLDKVVNNSTVLVFDFKHISCKTCFEDEMIRIIEVSKDIGINNVIFVSEFTNNRKHYVLEKKYGIKIYNLTNNYFGLPIEKGNYPFIFVIDSNFMAKDFYIPTQAFFNMGNIYYSIIYDKYFRPMNYKHGRFE